ncbi:MAG: DUF4349 domain-containing protein [Pseudomonadota bacterium]
MTIRFGLAGLAAALILSACGGGGGDAVYEEAEGGMLGSMDMAVKSAPRMAQDRAPSPVPPPPPPPDGEPAPEAAEQYIAYSHSLGFRLPVAQVEPVMMGHAEACRAAGTSVCIVTNSNLNNQSDDYVSGNLSIRAKPEWIEAFMAGVDAEADAAGGEISYRNTSAEDLTRTIIDTDARLTATKTLQSRLQTLLETRDGELSELLAIERELARVNSEIDSTESYLRALRLRVSMSQLSIGYETKLTAFGPRRQNPLGEALSDFFYNLSGGLAGVITAFAVGLPWLFLIGVMLWIWLRVIWPRIRRKKT